MLHNLRRKRLGVAAVELAICMPVVVLLVVSTIEACSMVFLKQSLAIAAYEGARTAIIPNATSEQVQATCKQILKDRNVIDATITVKPANITILKPGDLVDVTISATCGANSIIPNKFYRGKTLSSTASMMIEF